MYKSVKFVCSIAMVLGANCVSASDNYHVSLLLTNPDGEELMSFYQLLSGAGGMSSIDSKSYFIKECSSSGSTKTVTQGGKAFLYGHDVSVFPNKGIVELTEYYIDDSKYKNYDKDDCFQNEVNQLKFNNKVKVSSGQSQEFNLNSGNKLTATILN